MSQYWKQFCFKYEGEPMDITSNEQNLLNSYVNVLTSVMQKDTPIQPNPIPPPPPPFRSHNRSVVYKMLETPVLTWHLAVHEAEH